MRILLTLGTSTGGVGMHVRALARELSADHTVAIAAPESTIEHFHLRGAPVTVHAWPVSTRIHPRDLRAIWHLRSQIREFRPDIIHAHGFRAGLLTLLARTRTGVPVVVSWHNQASGRGVTAALERAIERFVARRADLTLGASEDLAQRARAVGGRRVLFAPVAAPAPAAVSTEVREETRGELLDGAAPETLLVLMVGRVAPQKNYDLLIDIAGHLRQTPVRVVVAGAADPATLTALEGRIDAAELGEVDISFLGARDDISALMSAADVYLLTSHWEARALVLQEALLAGLPIIASAVGGIPELVGEAGILLDPASPQAPVLFAEAIRELTDPAVRRHWSELSAARGHGLPDEEQVAQIITEHYRSLLATQ